MNPTSCKPIGFSICLLRPLSAIIASLVLIVPRCYADERQSSDVSSSLSPAERKLIELVDTAFKEYDAFYEKAESISDPQERSEFKEKEDPSHRFVPRLLAFEEQHSGTRAGLMALRRLVLLAAGGGSVDTPSGLGRREAMKRLPKYLDRAELPSILTPLASGDFDPSTEGLLRGIAANSKADSAIREFSKLTLARWMLFWRDVREYAEQRIQQLANGASEKYPNEMQYLERRLKNVPSSAQMRVWEGVAGTVLREIADSKVQLRQPAVKQLDPNWHMVQFDPERTKTMPLLSEVAAGLLFKESHLRIGKPAPDLKVALVSGQDWSLTAQKGKVVIIQFSFKGCGPCEAMYPVLRDIQQAQGKQVSILSIMHDENRADTDNAVSEGKLTWNVYWDGFRGPVSTHWAVRGFPTIYVFDRNGLMAGEDLRGQDLKDKVGQLLQ